MNKDIFEGKWNQIIGLITKKWGEITDDDFTKIKGDSTRLFGFLQEKFGVTKEEAQKHLTSLNLDDIKEGISDKASDLLGKLKR